MDPVRSQYEAYPYPARDPADEAKGLRVGSPSRLAEIDHYLFAGGRAWTRPCRALVAGGGTGDGLVMLAQQLADDGRPHEIVYLDLSRPAREIAQARVAARGLASVAFYEDSLLNAAAYGRFDYVDCCGVLHHLDEPDAGFAALAEALRPDGGMGLMVYGALGRRGVYDMQAMLRMVAGQGPSAKRVAVAKALLAGLPGTNWLRRNPEIRDHRDGEAGIFDLFLHARDRAYRVAELERACARAGLAIVSFIEPARYDPDLYLEDADLRARLARLTPIERAGFAELLAGNMRKHVAYVARPEAAKRPAMPGPEMVPVLIDLSAAALARALDRGPLKLTIDGFALEIDFPEGAGELVAEIDGRRDLAAIARARALDPIAFNRLFGAIYGRLNGLNKLLLRRPR